MGAIGMKSIDQSKTIILRVGGGPGYEPIGEDTNGQAVYERMKAELAKRYPLKSGSGYRDVYVERSCKNDVTLRLSLNEQPGVKSASIPGNSPVTWQALKDVTKSIYSGTPQVPPPPPTPPPPDEPTCPTGCTYTGRIDGKYGLVIQATCAGCKELAQELISQGAYKVV